MYSAVVLERGAQVMTRGEESRFGLECHIYSYTVYTMERCYFIYRWMLHRLRQPIVRGMDKMRRWSDCPIR